MGLPDVIAELGLNAGQMRTINRVWSTLWGKKDPEVFEVKHTSVWVNDDFVSITFMIGRKDSDGALANAEERVQFFVGPRGGISWYDENGERHYGWKRHILR